MTGDIYVDSSRLVSEETLLRALLAVAETCGYEERAAFFPRSANPTDEPEAERIANDHGFGPDRLIAMRGLARSRGVSLELVLRAALRGDLVSIVRLPPVAKGTTQ